MTKINTTTSKKSAFVAYTDGCDTENAIIVLDGVRKANAVDANPIHYESWEFNDISGRILISPIIEGIDSSSFLVADITYLNLNVVYEIGYAIGRRKKVLLIRNSNIEGDQNLAKSVGIFDTIGYSNFASDEDLKNKFTSYISEDPLPFELAVNNKAPVYVVPCNEKLPAATSLISRIKKAGYRYRSFSASEDVRLSATDAISQVAKSAGVITMLDENDQEQMIRAMFVAGLAGGMNKPLLIMAPYGTETSLDVRDQVKIYKDQTYIADIVADFCPEITAKLQESSPPPISAPNLLGQISVGDPTAENEMTTLGNYFLQTDQYLQAARGGANLVVGRKGAGKTALFISLRDTTRTDKRNIVVDLKPESYQLVKLKDEILERLAKGARQHLITAFWEYLILLEVAYKLLEKDRRSYRFNHEIREIYEELETVYKGTSGVSEGDFSERVMRLSQNLSEKYSNKFGNSNGTKISEEILTEILYSHDLKNLKRLVSNYLEHKGNVLVLFDNLDKSWSTAGVDGTDAITLMCLIDASRKVERDMQKQGHIFRCVVFVRNDVYQHLMKNSPDYGKEMRVTLDWSDPDLLRELLRLRLVSSLADDYKGTSFSDIWAAISELHVFGEESSSFLIERSLMRPRNILKLFNHSRSFAVNFGKEKIAQEDFYKGLNAYSQDLLIELDRELSDVYPEAKGLLYHFLDSNPKLTVEELQKIISEAEITESKIPEIQDFLLYHGVLGLSLPEKDQYIFDVGYDIKKIHIRLEKLGDEAMFVLNPAFTPVLEIKDELFNRQASFALNCGG